MKIVVNKLTRPLRVPLPQGKVLHLGPRQEGQVGDNAADHEPLKALVEKGELEVRDSRAGEHHDHGREGSVRDRTSAFGPPSVHSSGDR